MHDIVLYSTGCPVCKMLEMRLAMEGIKYTTVKDVPTMQGLGIKSAPMLGVDGELLNATQAIKWLEGAKKQ